MADLTPIYIATAYRWGDANGHSYVVHVGLDEEAARDAAEEEADSRGGKYGADVVRWRGEQSERVAYFPGLVPCDDCQREIGREAKDIVERAFAGTGTAGRPARRGRHADR